MPRKIHSKAQWGLLFAKAGRGEIHGGIEKVKEMARGVRYGSLPDYKRRVRRRAIAAR